MSVVTVCASNPATFASVSAQHNVKLQLSYLDVAPDGTPPSKQALKTEAMLRHALQPPKEYGGSSSGSGSSGAA